MPAEINLQLITAKIDRYRSVKAARVDGLGSYNLFIGQNNVGKSNVLRAVADSLEFLATSKLIEILDLNALQDLYFENEREKTVSIRLAFTGWSKYRDQTIGPELTVGMKISKSRSGVFFRWISNIALVHSKGEATNREDLYMCSPIGSEELCELYVERTRLLAERDFVSEIGAILAKNPANAALLANEYATVVRAVPSGKYRVFDDSMRAIWAGTVAQVDVPGLHQKYLAQVASEIADTESTIKDRANLLIAEKTKDKYEKAQQALSRIKVYRSKESPEPLTSKDRNFLFNLSTSFADQRRWAVFSDTISRFLRCDIRPLRGGDGETVIQLDRFLDLANGSGIRGALRLLVDIEATQPTIAFLEEPELHLHPTLARALATYLRLICEKTQLFIASHSAEFVNSEDTDEYIYLTTHTDESTHVRGLRPREAALPIVDEIGLRPSSILMYDRIVLVEGNSDEQILRAVASSLGKEGSLAGVGFIHLKGATALSYYAAQEVVSLLNRRRVRVWAVLDRDETTEAELVSLRARFDDFPKTKLVIWKRREIENYLLNPLAIAEELTRRRASSTTKTPVTAEEVIDELANIDAELRAEMIRRRLRKRVLKPAYFGKKITTEEMPAKIAEKIVILQQAEVDFPKIVQETQTEVEAIPADALQNVAPGAFILEQLYQQFDCNFDKADGADIVRRMPKKLIPDEFVALIDEITMPDHD